MIFIKIAVTCLVVSVIIGTIYAIKQNSKEMYIPVAILIALIGAMITLVLAVIGVWIIYK